MWSSPASLISSEVASDHKVLDSLLMPPPARRLAAIPLQQPSSHDERRAISPQASAKNTSGTPGQPPAVVAETPSVKFCDIVGHKEAKLRLEEALLPLALVLPPEILVGIRAGSSGGILLHGPPGCGKTQLARALAGEAAAAFVSISPADVLSKYVGESEASIRNLFSTAKQEARQKPSRCCVLFLDEIDALGQTRNSVTGGSNSAGTRVLAELLIQLTQLSNEQRQQQGQDDFDERDLVEFDRRQGICCAFCGEPQQAVALFAAAAIMGDDDRESIKERRLRIESQQGDRVRILQPQSQLNPLSASGATTGEVREQRPKQSLALQIQGDIQRTNSTGPYRVIVVAATNRPEDCDPALLRRFAVRALIDLPTFRDRCRMIKGFLTDIHHKLNSSDIKQIAFATERFSGSDLESLSREAIMAPVRDCLKKAATLKRRAQRQQQIKKKHRPNYSSAPTSLSPSRQAPSVLHPRHQIINETDPLTTLEKEPNELAREYLLSAFRQLRPVLLQDFERAYTFWIGDPAHASSAEELEEACTNTETNTCNNNSVGLHVTALVAPTSSEQQVETVGINGRNCTWNSSSSSSSSSDEDDERCC